MPFQPQHQQQSPPLWVGLLRHRGFQGPLPQPRWCLWICPQDTRTLSPGIPSSQALAPRPQHRARGNRRMGDAMRAKEGPRERLHAGTGPPGGAEHSGQSGEGSTSSPWPVRPASCLAPTCLALLGLGRSPDSLFPGLGWEPQGLHLQLRGQGPLRQVPTPRTEDVPLTVGSTPSWTRGHTPGGLGQGAAGRRGCHVGRAGGSWAEPGHPVGL